MARGTAQISKRVRRPEPAHVVPHEGLVGAHTQKREPAGEAGRGDDDADVEPTGAACDVAPTKRAEQRERERHQLERDLGHVPAGEEGALRARRGDDVTRDQLDEAGRAADRAVAGHDLGVKH